MISMAGKRHTQIRITIFLTWFFSTLLGLAFKFMQIQIWGWLDYMPFATISFATTLFYLFEYSWRNRRSLLSVLGLLMVLEVVGIAFFYLGQTDISNVLLRFSGILFPVTGIILLQRSGKLAGMDKVRFILAGVLAILSWSVIWSWDIPFHKMSYVLEKAIKFSIKGIFLGFFASLLWIDWKGKLIEKGEKALLLALRVGQLWIIARYFRDYVFI